ncbi:hypothetical protein PN499_23530 [Kamptonema animale CS-326]|jgi:hypothetical protein|uniref:hypothetical protein n=1 Tax=Kamptonema animale TaxID=92934 RepID=UPI0023313CB3|nr:hypothetical protein [Kamptonema animale]MDB9514175.1 hypothetical protein [Kamptonema animale CS-326]
MTKLSPFNPTHKDLPKDSGVCKLNNFALFEGPDITDITDKPDPGCPEAINKLEKYKGKWNWWCLAGVARGDVDEQSV